MKLKKIQSILSNYSKVFENYFFMTFLQGANLLIGLLLYPYLIRVLGKESYGTYVFVLSNINFFIAFISFGFSHPALKKISLCREDHEMKNQVVSSVLSAKFYLFLLSSCILSILLFTVPFLKENKLLYILVFSGSLNEVLFPTYYFQGMQKMKFVTYIQLMMRILTIPLILIFVKTPDDILIYAFVVSALSVAGGIFSIFYLRIKEHIVLKLVVFKELKTLFQDSLPFFGSIAFGTIKQETIILFIGTFFNKQDVAIYDLANKIIAIPRLITHSINSAIFPSVINDINSSRTKKIIRSETLIGLVFITLIALFGYWAVLFLGGYSMLSAYPMSIILSVTIYTWLIVGCYINYIFIPQSKYNFIAKNQIAALFSFAIISLVGICIYKNILVIILAYSLSSIVEVLYCKYVIRKHKLYDF